MPRKRHLLVAATPALTYYMPGDRTTASFKTFVLPGLAGVVVHDRYQVYDHPQPGTLTHQLCCAHLLRDLEDAAQTYLGASWPAQITHALQGLIHAASSARQAGLAAVPTHIASPLISAYRDGIHTGLSDLQKRGGTTRQHRQRLLEDLRDREDDVLRFVSDLRIPPTSNQAERDLRPAKTQEKISGRAAVRTNHPPALRHPRLPLHRQQTRHQRAHRPARRDRREPTRRPPIPAQP